MFIKLIPGADVIKLFYLATNERAKYFCPWPAFLAWSNICGQGKELALEWST
jgi:hypothetical protein